MFFATLQPRWKSLPVVLIIILAQQVPVRAQTNLEPPTWSVKELIEFQQQHHPRLGAQDVYKLFFEAAFGVGHVLADSSAAVSELMDELASVDSTSSGELLLEPISLYQDVVRVNLRSFKALNLNPSLLVKVMFQSARETLPDTLLFTRLWNEFSSLVRYGMLRFPADEVRVWNAKVEAGSIEAVHHSPEYTAADRPAYRVVKRDLFEAIFGKISQ